MNDAFFSDGNVLCMTLSVLCVHVDINRTLKSSCYYCTSAKEVMFSVQFVGLCDC